MSKTRYEQLLASEPKPPLRRNSSWESLYHPREGNPSANGDAVYNNRDSSDSRLDELDPLRDPNLFGEESDDDDIRGTSRKPSQLRHRRYGSEKGLSISRAYEANSSTRIPKLPVWLVPRRSNYCTVILLGVIGLVSVLILSGTWAQKHKEEQEWSSHTDGLVTSPPWYPSPRGGVYRTWEESYKKAATMVSAMSLIEKVNITTGTGWRMGPCVGNTGTAHAVGFPSLCLQDGPQGLRFADHITAGPAGITVGATWNKMLMKRRGRMMGQEARAKGVNVVLGPAVGALGRMPAGGRNWEGFGSDPVLQGIAAAETVKGIQEEGVMATIKHFVGNEQEHFRQEGEWGTGTAISSNIDDRTLHEVYAWPFADSVRAGVASVMCSYNQVNNSFACQNSKLLNGILKDELGFQGFVQSDWLAQRSGVASALAGLDMSMPGDGFEWAGGVPYWGYELTKSVVNGTLPMERVDDMVTRIVAAWFQMSQDDRTKYPGPPNFSSWTNEERGKIHPGSDDDTEDIVNWFIDAAGHGDFSHKALSRRIAAEGIVLLKNDNHMLPLDTSGRSQDYEDGTEEHKSRIAVIGEDAVVPASGPNLCEDRACNKGTLASGWGSGAVEFPYLVSPADAIQHVLDIKRVGLTVIPTNDLREVGNTGLEVQDRCIVFVNSDSGEGFAHWNGTKGDRNDLNLQNGGDALIEHVINRCGRDSKSTLKGKVIVVVHAVGPVILESFITNPNIGAVLYAGLPGQESGNALADVLFGHINPSGHLPFTIGKSLEDYGRGGQIMYEPNEAVPQQFFDEGTLIDYRWFDAKRITPRFEFGFGKSYSEFKLNSLKIQPIIPAGQKRPTPTSGDRPWVECQPPTYDSKIPPAQDLVFPSGWRKLKKYIYPYLDYESDARPGDEYPMPPSEYRSPSPAGGREGGHPALWDVIAKVEVDVTNLGSRDGSAVIQTYLIFPNNVEEETQSGWSLSEKVRDGDRRSNATYIEEYLGNEQQKVKRQETFSFAEPDLGDLPPADPTEPAQPPEPVITQEPPPLADADATSTQTETETTSTVSFDPNAKSPFDLFKESRLLAGASLRSEILQHQSDLPKAVAESLIVAGTPLPLGKAFTGEPAAPTKVHTVDGSQTALTPVAYSTGSSWGNHFSNFITGRKKDTIIFAPRLLRGFEKVHLRGAKSGVDGLGERKTVTIELTRRDFSYWSVRQQNWVIPDGTFGIEVGLSSRDLRVRGRIF